jgi:hypothetical protein
MVIAFMNGTGIRSRLKRIEASSPPYSSLESLIIPWNVHFIDGFPFANVQTDSISVEAGNLTFEMANEMLIDIVSCQMIPDL